jgi:hypothetical protein
MLCKYGGCTYVGSRCARAMTAKSATMKHAAAFE